MSRADMVIHLEEFRRLEETLRQLRYDADARAVLLIDKNGQPIATEGDTEGLDTTSLASLTAGNVAATDGLAQLIGEEEFPVLVHEGLKENIHISVAAKKAILVVIFDQRSSLGLVRLRVKRANSELTRIFEEMTEKSGLDTGPDSSSPFAEITDDDIDALFGD